MLQIFGTRVPAPPPPPPSCRMQLSVVLLLLLCFARTTVQSNGSTTIVTMDDTSNHGGIAFIKLHSFSLAQNYWVLCLEHSLENYYSALRTLREEIRALNSTLKITRMSTFDRNITEVNGHIKQLIGLEIEKLLLEIDQTENNLANVQITMSPVKHTRHKRGLCDGCGAALNFLFGVAQSSDIEELNDKINDLAQTEDQLRHLTANHLTILNTTSHMASENAQNLKRLTSATQQLTDKMAQLSETIGHDLIDISRRLNNAITISSSIRLLQSVLQSLQLQINELERAWAETATGTLSSYFLPPVLLTKTVNDISQIMGRKFEFLVRPDEKHYYQFYQFSNVVATSISEHRIRLFIEFPLSNDGHSFDTFLAQGIAINKPGTNLYSYSLPEKRYLAVSRDLTLFLTLDSQDLEDCHGHEFKVCSTRKEIKRIPQNSCLISSFLGQSELASKICETKITSNPDPLFLNAPHSNEWIFNIPKKTRTVITCPGPDLDDSVEVDQRYLQGSGKLILGPHCQADIGGNILISRIVGTSTVAAGNSKTSILVPNLRPIWNEILNSSEATQAYVNYKIGFLDSHDYLQSTFDSIEKVVQTSESISKRQLEALYDEAALHSATVSRVRWTVNSLQPVSYTALAFAMVLFGIFIARYFLVYRPKLDNKRRNTVDAEVAIPLTEN